MCISPLYLKERGCDVPCGKCADCKARRISGWSFRLMKEAEIHTSAFFVTLTYEKPPMTPKNFMTINKRDLQLFFKKIRKYGDTIKYYACGEYGGKFDRPHYHVILFGAKVENIQRAWTHGYVHFGEVTGASVGYTLKYMAKDGKIPKHQNDDRLPEFALMSKKMGSNYMTTRMIKWHLLDLYNRYYVPLPDGKKIAMPRYYKEKIYTSLEREMIGKEMVNQQSGQLVEKGLLYVKKKLLKEELIRLHKNQKSQNKRLTESI